MCIVRFGYGLIVLKVLAGMGNNLEPGCCVAIADEKSILVKD
jgi:hypothetical protein